MLVRTIFASVRDWWQQVLQVLLWLDAHGWLGASLLGLLLFWRLIRFILPRMHLNWLWQLRVKQSAAPMLTVLRSSGLTSILRHAKSTIIYSTLSNPVRSQILLHSMSHQSCYCTSCCKYISTYSNFQCGKAVLHRSRGFSASCWPLWWLTGCCSICCARRYLLFPRTHSETDWNCYRKVLEVQKSNIQNKNMETQPSFLTKLSAFNAVFPVFVSLSSHPDCQMLARSRLIVQAA